MQGREIKVSELSAEQKQYLSSFYGFAKEYLKLPIYDGRRVCEDFDVRDRGGRKLYRVNGAPTWQRNAIDAVDKHGSRTTLRTANGAGKTSIVIPAVSLPHAALLPKSRVLITSGVERQVKEQIMPALRAHEPKLRGWEWQDKRILAPNGSIILGFTAESGGKAEGWHGNKEELYDFLSSGGGPLLIIVDECKSVAPEILDAIERCTYQRLLYVSSCGPAEGEFYRSHHDHAQFFQPLRASAEECPHADHAKNVLLIEQRGIDDPLVQSKVLANFMTTPGDAVIPRAAVDALMTDALSMEHRAGERKFMCDFAAGGAENVFGERNGNRITLKKCWREKDTMKACGQFILEFRNAGLSQAEAWMIHGDNSGLGKVVIDRLHELGWAVTRVDNGSAAREPERYVNLSAEVWWEGSKLIEKRACLLPNDPLLAAQLSTRKPKFQSNGRLGVESKEEMAARGVESPDRADVVLELLAPLRALRPQSYLKEQTPFETWREERVLPAHAGFDAGG